MTVATPGIPPLRFPQFVGDWHARQGGNAFDQRRERGEGGLPLYSVTIDRGIVRRDSLDREISSAMEDEGNLRVRKDDLAYNMMRMWQGAVGRVDEDGMVSPAYVVLVPKAETDSTFFEHWFKRSRSLYLLWAYSHGLTNDRLRLYFRDFSKVPMTLPDRDEQQMIAGFLRVIDERIALLTRKAEALTRYKREVARRLFAREIRFRRDDSSEFPDWKDKRLKEIGKVVGGGTPDTNVTAFWDGGIVWFTPSEVKSKYLAASPRTISAVGLKRSSAKLLPPGTLLISTRASVGDVSIAKKECTTNQGFQNIIVNDDQCNEFWYYWIVQNKKKFVRRAAGSTFLEISKTEVEKIPAEVPHIDEQRRIADFLSSLDNKLDAVNAKVTAMQTFKKGLMQQMFV